MLTVDVHNHFAPPEIIAGARSGQGLDGLRVEVVDGREYMVHRQGFRWPIEPTFYDLEARLAAMDARDTDLAVLSLAPTLLMYWLEDATAAADFARLANAALASFAAGSGGRIAPVATLPMQDTGAAVAELRRAVTELGMKGAQIGPRMEELGLDHERVRPVLAEAARLGVPLILHPYNVGKRAGLERFYLSNLIGNPLESTVGAAHLIFGGVLDELPDLRLVLMHGGGYLPYQIGRLDHGHHVRPESRGCAHEPSAYLRRFWYDTITHAAAPLRFLVDQVGADRVVYGTDFPFDMGGGPAAEQLGGVKLDDPDRELISGRNAVDLFDLPAGA
ncbi:amidohydrolase family protein [Phytohabitans sp. ZYX-F-186]|uniref:Amidohydrolase family protein n=1 Tax=Phytohabitans maris TaxID=3071409 RepID=A0ABU0ZTM9_9ACTN|nr:amidohydrolase family protein [Phytohabitans sp. ZYX-F-186]MDQ7910347.1 amidohydrolase family protein [Phytohabitans sp. ZYX-F-186]